MSGQILVFFISPGWGCVCPPLSPRPTTSPHSNRLPKPQIASVLISFAGLMFSFHNAPIWHLVDLVLIKYEGHYYSQHSHFAIITKGLQGSPRRDRPVNHPQGTPPPSCPRQAGGERCWQTSSGSLKDTRQPEHVCASRASLFQCKLIRLRFILAEKQSTRTEIIK